MLTGLAHSNGHRFGGFFIKLYLNVSLIFILVMWGQKMSVLRNKIENRVGTTFFSNIVMKVGESLSQKKY